MFIQTLLTKALGAGRLLPSHDPVVYSVLEEIKQHPDILANAQHLNKVQQGEVTLGYWSNTTSGLAGEIYNQYTSYTYGIVGAVTIKPEQIKNVVNAIEIELKTAVEAMETGRER